MSTGGLPTGADWVRIVEAVYAPVADDHAWTVEVVATAQRVLGIEAPSGFVVHRHAADLGAWDHLFHATVVSQEHTARAHREMVDVLGTDGLREVYYPPSLVATQHEIWTRLSPAAREYMRGYLSYVGVADTLGLVAHPEPGVVAVLFFGSGERIRLSRHARATFARLALHVEAALRLRLRPESVKAIVDTTGEVVHHTEGAPASAALSLHARRIERARTRKHRTTAEALDLWSALLSGKVSFVERTEGKRRFYYVVENAHATQPFRTLTRSEIDVLSQSARGLSAKLVAYGLGISETRVSSLLASAASKVGLSTRLELIRVAAMLTRDPRARFEELALTTAERDVLELLSRGLSNSEIARIRGRSLRTIANQVARLLEKTDSPTRRALATRAV